MESPEKRRLGTFGSAGSINYPDRKAYPEGHPLRPVPGATRHSSLGDHKSLETEALAEVSVGQVEAKLMENIFFLQKLYQEGIICLYISVWWLCGLGTRHDIKCQVINTYKRVGKVW